MFIVCLNVQSSSVRSRNHHHHRRSTAPINYLIYLFLHTHTDTSLIKCRIEWRFFALLIECVFCFEISYGVLALVKGKSPWNRHVLEGIRCLPVCHPRESFVALAVDPSSPNSSIMPKSVTGIIAPILGIASF
ncbi:hypothetical protein L1987_72433 [Smallanthus sonchifolius]|uniref:Uncharacterized protein n=1 Tax=Smallanthus sonchifolius TaxID=185202 RepID=A0ACB9AVH8_9ASTR|nr:hypothetical protein L1987_72433 [Smallanthus sonchifolius]